MNGAGFPHSEIFGLKRACRSPKLIAACCVLRRLMTPRHPSIAVTGFMQTPTILGVYLTHLHIYLNPGLSKNEIFPDPSALPRLVHPSAIPPARPARHPHRVAMHEDGGPRWT